MRSRCALTKVRSSCSRLEGTTGSKCLQASMSADAYVGEGKAPELLSYEHLQALRVEINDCEVFPQPSFHALRASTSGL